MVGKQNQINSPPIKRIFALQTILSFPMQIGRGKSGQQRAACFLTGRDSLEMLNYGKCHRKENYRKVQHAELYGKDENVR